LISRLPLGQPPPTKQQQLPPVAFGLSALSPLLHILDMNDLAEEGDVAPLESFLR
jgi:hypothetical protein